MPNASVLKYFLMSFVITLDERRNSHINPDESNA